MTVQTANYAKAQYKFWLRLAARDYFVTTNEGCTHV